MRRCLAPLSVLVILGCGRSPAAKAPSKLVGIPAGRVVVVEPCDDDDDDDVPAAARTRVEYVPIEEWQPPPSARRIEAKIPPRGTEASTYLTMPALTLHQPIEATRVLGRGRYYR